MLKKIINIQEGKRFSLIKTVEKSKNLGVSVPEITPITRKSHSNDL